MSKTVKMIIAFVLVAAVTFAAVYFGDKAITVTPVPGELPEISIGEQATDLLVSSGVAILIMAGIELLKVLNLLPDGTAGKVQVIAQAVAYLGILFANGFFGFDVYAPTVQQIIAVGTVVLQAAISIVGAFALFKGLRAAKVLKPLPGRE